MANIPISEIPNAPQMPGPVLTKYPNARVELRGAADQMMAPTIEQGAFDGPAEGLREVGRAAGQVGDVFAQLSERMMDSKNRADVSRAQTIMEPGTDSGIKGWRTGDSREATEHNVGLLAMREADLVKERLSIFHGLRYDLGNHSFYDGEYRIPADKVQTYISDRISEVDPGFSQAIGESTLRRALATSAGKGPASLLDGGQLGGLAKAPPSLRQIRYSKDAGGDSGVSESGRGTSGEESGGVSGEAGRGGSSPELRAARTEQVQAWVKSVRKGWKSKLDVVIHDSAEAIPDDALRSKVQSEGGSVEAFFNPRDGNIHLLADRVSSKADAERLLRHEGIHWVLGGPMRQEYQAILKGVQKQISKEEWESLSKSYADAPDHVRVEEYLAYLGQTNPGSTIWQSFVYEVKRFLRSTLGAKIEITDGDVLAFLKKANRKLEKEGDSFGGAPRRQSLSKETAFAGYRRKTGFFKKRNVILEESDKGVSSGDTGFAAGF